MGLPISDPSHVGAQLVDVVLEANHLFNVQDLPDWINAVGLLLSYLPDVFFDGLKKRLVTALTSAPLSQWNLPQNPFEMFNFIKIARCGTLLVSSCWIYPNSSRSRIGSRKILAYRSNRGATVICVSSCWTLFTTVE